MTLLQARGLMHRASGVQVDHLAIDPAEVLAVVGPSGAGKTTLLRLLNLLEKPDAGSIHFRGEPVAAQNRLAVQRQMCLVTQKTALFDTTVAANLTYGLRVRGEAAPPALVSEWLERIGLKGLGGRPARTLSGGEAQRVAIARAAILRPALLLLDEPTANLDPANVAAVEELVQWLNREHGTAVVVVTHNLFQARRLATRGAYMEAGRLVEVGARLFESAQDPRTEAFLAGRMVY